MKYYKFKKDQDHYKKDEVIQTEKPNNLIKQWVEEGVISETKKPVEKKVENK